MSDQSKVVSVILKNRRTTTAAMALRLAAPRSAFSGDYTMEPGESFRIRAWGASQGELTIELADQGSFVTGPAASFA
jgi:hypothetical protein